MIDIITKFLKVLDDNYTYIRVSIYILSIIVSLFFIIVFLIKKKEIAKCTKIENDENIWKKYVGAKSFFYQKYNSKPEKKENINRSFKRGIEKNLRYLYTAWFCVFILTGLISVISIIKPFPKEFLETEWNEIKDMKTEDIDTTRYSIFVSAERENSNYENHKELTTSNDSLDFQLVMRIESPFTIPKYSFTIAKRTFKIAKRTFKKDWTFIKFDYPIGDSITVKFIKPLEKPFENEEILESISDSIIIQSVCSKKRFTEYIKKEDLEKNNGDSFIVKFYDTIKIDTIEVDILTAHIYDTIYSKSNHKYTVRKSIWTNRALKLIDSLEKSKVYGEEDYSMESKNNNNKFKFNCRIKREKNDKGEYINTIVRSHPKDSLFKYQKFFNDDTLSKVKSEELIHTIYQVDSIYQADAVLKRIAQDNATLPQKKPSQKRNLYMTITSILSLSANVILLLLFGFLSTKTDLFSREKNKYSVFPIYRNFVIIIFVIISVILLLDAFPSPPLHFSESFMFVVNLIIALTSVIAVFGCWGSMNNSYTSFPSLFKFCMIFYAMSQYLELHIPYSSDAFFNKVAELALLVISVFAKAVIIYMLLSWLPNKKRALWYFFTSANNFRTEEDYEDFLQIVEPTKTTPPPSIPKIMKFNLIQEIMKFYLIQKNGRKK